MANKSAARQRAAEARAKARAAERRRRLITWTSIVAVVVIAGGAIAAVAATSGGSKKHTAAPAATTNSALGPEGIPIEQGTVLAPASTSASGQTVDGIQCNTNEQVAYHIHSHLAVYDNGVLRPVPIGIGIVTPEIEQTAKGPFAGATRCYYWLHVHAQDGVIHIESPSKKIYTLGQFFDEWRQQLSTSAVAGLTGQVTAYVNGKQFSGDPRTISLTPHAVIQLDVGTVVPPQPVDWSTSSL